MAAKKLTVVISQGQGKNPTKRHLEEEIAAALIMEPDIEVSIVPHLYDLLADHTGMLFLKSVSGNMVVLSWLFPRAARWILDRNGVRGQAGISLLPTSSDEEADEEELEQQEIAAAKVDAESSATLEPQRNTPQRKIYCLDLRDQTDPKVYLDEVRRIAREGAVQTVDLMSWIGGSPKPAQLERYLQPAATTQAPAAPVEKAPLILGGETPVARRWYPVIDYSRCTNCMECIDFCLFGVYGVDTLDQILVEQQDNCKKGCPACSRVCPENAIIFPEHKTPGIAGAEGGEVTGLKIDLSKLFGAPSALEMAVLERDTELVADGRTAVGMAVGIPKRQSHNTQVRDDLDDLMDGLDSLDL